MINLAAWAFACVVITVLTLRRPGTVLVLVLILRFMVPSYAGGALLGGWPGSTAIHPATILLLAGGLLHLNGRRKEIAKELNTRPWVYGVVLACVATFAVISFVERGPNALLGMLNVFIAPFIFMMAMNVEAQRDPLLVARLRNVFLLLATVQIPIILAQVAYGAQIPWGAYNPALQARPLGTQDTPLDAGMFLAIAIPLLGGIKRGWIRYPLAIGFLGGIFLTESRLSSVLGIGACLVLAYLGTHRVRQRVFGGAVLIGLGVLLIRSPFASGVFARLFVDDGNSLRARTAAFDYAKEHISSVYFVGSGWGSSYELKGTVLTSSLESSYIILAFDLGLFFTLLLIAAKLGLIFNRGGPVTPGARLAGLMAMVLASGYSGLVNMSTAAAVLWFALALCCHRVVQAPPPADAELALAGKRGDRVVSSYRKVAAERPRVKV